VRRRPFTENEIEAIAAQTWEGWFIENPGDAVETVRRVLSGQKPAFDLIADELARIRELAGMGSEGAHAAP
jgi:hypothetical protein